MSNKSWKSAKKLNKIRNFYILKNVSPWLHSAPLRNLLAGGKIILLFTARRRQNTIMIIHLSYQFLSFKSSTKRHRKFEEKKSYFLSRNSLTQSLYQSGTYILSSLPSQLPTPSVIHSVSNHSVSQSIILSVIHAK